MPGDGEGKGFAGTGDAGLGSHAGMAVNVGLAADGKLEGQVRQTLLEDGNRLDFAFPAMEDGADVGENGRTGVADVAVVEGAEIAEGVELVDDAVGVAPDVHFKAREIPFEKRFPEILAGELAGVLLVHDADEFFGKGAVEVGVAHHAPTVDGGVVDAGDAAVAVGPQAPFAGGAGDEDGGVVGAVDVGLEDVFREIIVGGADVGVAEAVADADEGGDVVPAPVVLVDDQGDAELVPEIEELLLHVPDHERDVRDAGGM